MPFLYLDSSASPRARPGVERHDRSLYQLITTLLMERAGFSPPQARATVSLLHDLSVFDKFARRGST